MERVTTENINTVSYWDHRFATECDHVWDPADIVTQFAKLIPLFTSVLDVGVGGGMIYSKLRQLRQDLQYHGCDFSAEAIAALRKRNLGFESLFVWDVRTPPLPFLQFDVVLATELLEHLDEPTVAVKHMASMARLMLLVTVPNRNAITSPEHVWSYTPEDIINLLSPYGNVRVRAVRNGFNILGVACK